MEKAQIKYNDAVAKYGANSSQAQTAALNLEKTKNAISFAAPSAESMASASLLKSLSLALMIASIPDMASFPNRVAAACACSSSLRNVMVSLGLATTETANVIDNGKLQKAQTKVENKTIDMEKAQIKYNDTFVLALEDAFASTSAK